MGMGDGSNVGQRDWKRKESLAQRPGAGGARGRAVGGRCGLRGAPRPGAAGDGPPPEGRPGAGPARQPSGPREGAQGARRPLRAGRQGVRRARPGRGAADRAVAGSPPAGCGGPGARAPGPRRGPGEQGRGALWRQGGARPAPAGRGQGRRGGAAAQGAARSAGPATRGCGSPWRGRTRRWGNLQAARQSFSRATEAAWKDPRYAAAYGDALLEEGLYAQAARGGGPGALGQPGSPPVEADGRARPPLSAGADGGRGADAAGDPGARGRAVSGPQGARVDGSRGAGAGPRQSRGGAEDRRTRRSPCARRMPLPCSSGPGRWR